MQQGDTLYGIAKRHGVSISALIEANGLRHGSSVKPGQQLLLPAGAVPARASAPPPSRAPAAVAKAPPPAAPAAKKGWQGQHTMKAGESLYGIARQHGVTLAELQRVNGITEPTRVRVGAVLTVPERAESERAPPRHPRGAQGAPAAPSQARIINAPDEPKGERTATLGDRRNDASEPAAEPPSGREAAGPNSAGRPGARSSPPSASAPTAHTTTASTSPCRKARMCMPPRTGASPTPATSSRATATSC